MLSDERTDSPASGRTGVLVVCPSQLGDTVRKHISHLAARGWEKSGDITVLSIPNERVRDGMFVTSEINRTASRLERDLRLLTVRTVLCDQTRLRTQILISPADLGLSGRLVSECAVSSDHRAL